MRRSRAPTNSPTRFHQRDNNRSSLFSGYDQRSRPTSTSPNPYTASNGYSIPSSSNSTFAAYPGNGGIGTERAGSGASFRSATPDKRGAYSDAVLSELESQNDEQVSEMSKKVGMLKDLTLRIGDEIRDSTALAEKMNDQFSNTSNKLKGTMKRMLRMAQSTGVGWKVWLIFFAFVTALFWYVWLF
ncbi:putative BET1 v-SNARE [Aureobasidium pullulans]|uniref:BET1 v-SNARE n=1 Tax=Aureobasidium pullulans TaxID=5580 RepID=A0A4S9DKS1_AURPU|nr:putative BET1 v-SNARE [Aureobasidium pullulans]THX34524.1 putative BET1 v-SNARE [Aureobasidium pullulans]THX70508.1 putative BET1 v-SNARE [Aureobasidium pullulans]THY60980.1 putative BET1 v-SNARE [Aureobasidium pullulans]THZ45203.1 putative BET1 v-SNARE [Aureobasidium pullulans]